MKSNQYAVVGFLLGAVLGVLIGFGELSMIKKSQRDAVMPFAVIGTALAFGVGGAKLGYNAGKDDELTTSLGLNSIKDEYYKEGKYWIGVSSWTNPQTGKVYRLTTARSNIKVLVSVLNDAIIINHNVEGATQANLVKYHSAAKQQVIKEIKAKGDYIAASLGTVEYRNPA
jgi:hypothetical protein